MSGKLPLLAAYAVLLLAGLVAPWLAAAGAAKWAPDARARAGERARKWVALAASFALGVVLLRLGVGLAWFVVLAVISLAYSGSLAAARSTGGLLAAAAAAAAGLLLWWTAPADLGWLSSLAAAIIAVAVAYGLRDAAAAPGGTAAPAAPYGVAATVTAAGAALLFLQPVEAGPQSFVAWHHWGAYLGAAEAVSAGLRPFYDIPLQYGIGPTLVLLPAAKSGGFGAMFWVVFASTVLGLFAVTAVCVDAVSGTGRRIAQWSAGACAAASCLFWVAQPWDVGTAMMTPSTFGLRFTPAFLLVFVLTRPAPWRGAVFATWALCLLWSVESAYYALVIYGSHQLLTHARSGSVADIARTVFRLAWQTALVLFIAIIAFGVAVGVFPSPSLFAFYALNPPGVLPVNWSGPVWWLLLAIGLGLYAASRNDLDDPTRLRLHVCLMACIAFASYYLGRSHDNNIVNLMPAAAMLLCCVVGAVRTGIAVPMARVAFATPLFLLPFFAFGSWPTAPGHDSAAYRDRMSYNQDKYPDIARALSFVSSQGQSADVLTTGAVNAVLHGPSGAWNALHPLTNFMFSPAPARQALLRAGAARLGATGWLVVDRRMLQSDVLRDFSEIYAIAQKKEFGGFVAIQFTPRGGATAERPLP